MKFELPKRKDELIKSILITLLAIAVMGVILFPVYYMFTVSIKPSGALATTELDLIPDKISAENYKELIIGRQEAKVKTKSFSLSAENAVVKDDMNRYKISLEDVKMNASYSTEMNLINAELLEYKAEDVRKERNRLILVKGEYAKLRADILKATRSIRNLNIEAKRVVIEIKNPDDSPVDLSKFKKVGENKYEANDLSFTVKDKVKIEAYNGEMETNNFYYVRFSKIGGTALGYMKRSLILAILTVIFTMTFVIPAAYAFSRLKFFGREHVLYFYLMFTQVAGGLGIAGLVALYGMLVKLNLVNNLYILPVVYAAGGVPFNTWLLKTYIDSISPDFDEAALVDGASYLQIIRHVLLPMALPGIATVTIFAFIGGWTELILANLLLNQENHPLSVWLFTMLANLRAVSWNTFAAAALIFALPVFIMFMLAQNYVRSGLTLGGLKE